MMPSQDFSRQILLINDMAGYGKVATAAMLPILSFMGLNIYNLPTALVSNTLDYGKFSILETTDYIESVFPVWRELGFRFGSIATGFIVSQRQAELVSAFCKEQAALGTTVFVDPIMGDDGRLYNGVDEGRVVVMREMVGVADLIFPNYTEAAALTGRAYSPDGVSWAEAKAIIDDLHSIGARSVLVTSIRVDGKFCVAGFNADNGSYFSLPFSLINAHFPGTGDIFSAVLIGRLINGMPLEKGVRNAMDVLWRMIDTYKLNEDKNKGLPIENCLSFLSL